MVVVGAGLGGLCCAVELARQGFEVCVLEQHSKPGGYAHGFQRRGFRFDASLHHFGGLDQGAMTRGLLEQLGVLELLEVERREQLLRVELPGLDITLPNDLDALMKLLGERFPSQRAGLVGFFGQLRRLKHHVTGPTTQPGFDLPPSERLSVQLADATLQELLDQHIDDPQLAALLSSPWPYIGLPPSQAAATFSACVLGSTWMEGAWRLRGGGEALSRALVKRLEAMGGRCYTRCPVARILVRDQRSAGVELSDGRRVLAPVVVSNADPVQTYRELLPIGTIAAPFLHRLTQLEPSLSFYALYLGLDCLPSTVGIEQDEHFVLQDADPDKAYERILDGELEITDWSIASFERADPGAAPPGSGVVTVMELCPARDWLDMDRETYQQRKAAVKERLMAKLGRRFPALLEHVVVSELATPRTMQRYTRNHHGAVYGWAQRPEQAGRRRLGNRAPLPGLYLTGAWTWAGGGYEGALMSGLQSAGAVMQQNPPPSPQPRRALAALPEDLPPILAQDRPDEIDPAFPQRVQARVFQDAVGPDGLLGPCAALRFLDRGRVEACEATCSATEQEDWLHRYLVNVYRLDVRFPAPAPLGSQLEIRTGLRQVSSHRAVFDQRIVAQDGDIAAEASVEVTFLDPELGLAPVPGGFDRRPPPRGAPGRGLPPVPFGDQDHFPHRQPQRVYYEDTDAQGIVYHVTTLRWCEQLLEGLLADEGLQARIERADIRYLEAARFADRLELRAGARPLDSARVAVDVRVVRQGDEVVVSDVTLELSFTGAGGAAAAVPQAIRGLLRG